MIVGVVPTGSGIVAVSNQFFMATDEADGVDQYVTGYTPPKDPADFLGFDTAWGSVQAAAPGKQWAYDRTGAVLLEIDLPHQTIFDCLAVYLLEGNGAVLLVPMASVSGPMLLSYSGAPGDTATVTPTGTDTLNGIAGPIAGLAPGDFLIIPTTASNWSVRRASNP